MTPGVDVGESIAPDAGSALFHEDGDEEEEQHEDEAHDRGHDLAAGHDGDEEPECQEHPAAQQDVEVSARHRPHGDRREAAEDEDIDQSRRPERGVEEDGPEELPQDGLGVRHGSGHQDLEGPRAALLREETHRDRRGEEKLEEPEEDRPPQEELHDRARRSVGPVVRRENQPEDETVQDQERRDDDVGDGGAEIRAELAQGDLPDAAHRASSGSPSASTSSGSLSPSSSPPSAPASPFPSPGSSRPTAAIEEPSVAVASRVVRLTKMSSRLS